LQHVNNVMYSEEKYAQECSLFVSTQPYNDMTECLLKIRLIFRIVRKYLSLVLPKMP
jgi:hypothetical protein